MDNSSLIMIFGILGNATGLMLYLVPILTFKEIILRRTTAEFSVVPYVMTLLNCLLSAWYGLPFVSHNNMLVTIVNASGAAIETVYVLIYIICAPKKQKLRTLILLITSLAIFSFIAVVSVFVFHHNDRTLFCGFASTVFCIVMYASPLSVMRMVIKTKSVEFMPFFLSLFVFLCGTSWFLYGLIKKDIFVAVPNGFGCLLGALQLVLYAIYRDREDESTVWASDEGNC